MSRRVKRIIAGVIGIGMIIVLLFFVNSFTGNPISKAIAKKAATEYINENYADIKNLSVNSCGYNFKSSRYVATVESRTSEDTTFHVEINRYGKVISDDYEYRVTSKATTANRLNQELFFVTTEILRYNLDYDFDSARLRFEDDQDLNNLKLDMELNIFDPPNPIVADVRLFDADVSYERIAEIAKDIELKMKEQRIPISYFSIRLIPLENKPKSDKEAYSWEGFISVNEFPASLMGEPELAQAIEKFELDSLEGK